MCWRKECWGRGREADWIGHVLRGDGLLRDVLVGRMLGKRPRGRPRREMIDDLMEGSFVKMKRRAEGRKEWIGYVLRGDGLPKDVLEGRMLGKRPQAKRRNDR